MVNYNQSVKKTSIRLCMPFNLFVKNKLKTKFTYNFLRRDLEGDLREVLRSDLREVLRSDLRDGLRSDLDLFFDFLN